MSTASRYELSLVRELAPEFAEQLRVMLAKQHETMVTEQAIRDANPSWCDHWRQILVEWMAESGDEYNFCPTTVEVAANYVDRMLAAQALPKDKLQLYGVAAILVATKLREYRVLRMAQVVHLTDNLYSRGEIRAAERSILETLGWRLMPVTPRQLLPYLSMLMPVPGNRVEEMEAWARYIAANAYTRFDFIEIPPALTVVASLDMATVERRIPIVGPLPPTLVDLNAHESMPRCRLLLADLREQLRERDSATGPRPHHGSPDAVSSAAREARERGGAGGGGSGADAGKHEDPTRS